jgi:hypothetical protein
MTAKWRAILALSLLPGMVNTPAAAQKEDVAVMVNEDNKVSTISPAELPKVFVGEKRSWGVGQPIKLLVTGPGTHERSVLLKFLGMSESEYKQYWTAQIFRGEAQAEPMMLPSVGMQIEALGVFAGGITLVSAAKSSPE